MQSPRLCFAGFELHPAERRLLVQGRPAALGARAFDVLLALIERRGRVVTKGEILEAAWPGLVVEENNLAVQISTLRKLLGPELIVTVAGRGYHFTGELQATAEEGKAPRAPSKAGSAAPPPAWAAGLNVWSAGNLPLHGPMPIGRAAELQALRTLVNTHPLTTVIGAGGMGKTTLAVATAKEVAGDFDEGAWLVELAPLTDPVQIAPAITQALRLATSGPGPADRQLAAALRMRDLLLVLDNCEHLVAAVGALVTTLLAGAAKLRVLVTSQEPLHIAGEHLMRVEPLGVPLDGETAGVEAHGAVALFVARARAVHPQFALHETNAAAVAELCRRLDGMPLAIELAAARVHLLGVHGLRERIGERLRVLTGGARTALPRHQTLAAMLAWSHSLLGPAEQTVLRRLAVFVGSFPIALAQAVAADEMLDEWAVFDALGLLVDKSMVAADGTDPPRYRLLESTRAFALERLHEAGETATLRDRHAAALRDHFVATDEARYGEEGRLGISAFMDSLVPELDNWRAAFDWTAGEGEDAAMAVALGGSGALVLRYLGQGQEALSRLLGLLPRLGARVPPLRAAWFLGRLAVLGGNGRMPRGQLLEVAERAVCLCREVAGARRALHSALCTLAWTRNLLGDTPGAAVLLPEASALERETDPCWLRSWRLNTQAAIESYQGRYDASAATLAEELALLERHPGEDIATFTSRCNLAIALNSAGRFEQAVAMAREGLGASSAFANRGHLLLQLLHAQVELGRLEEAGETLSEAMPVWLRDGMVMYAAAELAALMARQRRWRAAALLDGASERNLRDSGVRQHHLLQIARRKMLDEFAAAGVDPQTLDSWRQEGAALDPDQLAALCRSAPP